MWVWNGGRQHKKLVWTCQHVSGKRITHHGSRFYEIRNLLI